MALSAWDRLKFPGGVVVGAVLAVALVAVGMGIAGDQDQPAGGGTQELLLAGYSSSAPAGVDDDDYPHPYRSFAFSSDYTAPDGWGGFDSRNCTSFVAWRVTDRDKFDMVGWIAANGPPGHAKNWVSAFDGSVRHDDAPAPGSVGVKTSGKYGHVAWVRSVNGDGTIVVEDYNYKVTGEYGSWVVSAADFDEFLHFEDALPKAAADPVEPAPLAVVPNSGGVQGGTGVPLQGGPAGGLQGSSPGLQDTGSPGQGSPGGAVQGPANSGAGGGDQAAADAERQRQAAAAAEAERQAAAAEAERQRQAAAAAEAERQRKWDAQHPVYPVMNTSESPPDGVWWRNSPNQDDTSRTTGYGVYAGDRVRLNCYAWGGPAVNGNRVWYRATNMTRGWNGGESAGWISAHYVDDGTGFNQTAPDVQPC